MTDLKWSNLGTARLWYVLSTKATNSKKKDLFLRMSWDYLFDAAMAGEI